MAKRKWDNNSIPNQSGRVVIVTGSTSGLGKQAAKVLAGKGATVVMAVRNTQKGNTVVQEIQQTHPNAKVDVRKLDLSSLKSIHDFSEDFNTNYNRLDILINNAGVMACPFATTEDGFEIQMGVNHLGHFALTGLVMPKLKSTKDSRIVATSSMAHNQGNINFDDINWKNRSYKTWNAYGDSKIANLYFTYELARKLKGEENAPLVTAAHPGWTATELQRNSSMAKILNPLFSQNVEMGTLPTLRAAIDETAKQGDYYGPKGFMEMRGYPKVVKSNALSHNASNAKRLWELSEQLTGIQY
jgi:NAD(P)-dependent dehydrogenase (short-subunit alcohol dehydrogenase family)